jgi:murein DD-endopeptidase MepM/ murein hydrolase activator NlpD
MFRSLFALTTTLLLCGFASAQSFRAHHGLTEAEYQAQVNQYAAASPAWRPRKVDVVTAAGNTWYFSAIWEPWNPADAGQGWAARHGMTEAQLSAESLTLRNLGFKIVSVCGYENGITPLFAAIWHHDPTAITLAIADMTEAEYQSLFDYYSDPDCDPIGAGGVQVPSASTGGGVPPGRGKLRIGPSCRYRLVDVDGYLANGALRFVAVWYRDNKLYSAGHGMSRFQFDWEYKATGVEPVNIGAYPLPGGGVGFTKIWNPRPNDTVFSFSHLDQADFQSWFDTKTLQGYTLLDLGSYVVNTTVGAGSPAGAIRYCSIWKAPAGSNLLKLALPIGGAFNLDWVLVNYQDHDPGATLFDHTGGQWLYNNHNGTDLTLANFVLMDAGVPVYAAADGIVNCVYDDNFDRNTCGIVGGVCDIATVGSCGTPGNEVFIDHANGQRTWYTHLKRNSITVLPGEFVKRGQQIALVGSSGNSSDAHLHFAVLDPPYSLGVSGGDLVDPFEGPMGNSQNLWMSLWPYQQSTLNILDGDTSDHAPTRLEQTERPPKVTFFQDLVLPQIWFWFQLNGTVTSANSLTLRLYRPDAAEHVSGTFPISFSNGTSAQYGVFSQFIPTSTLAGIMTGPWRWALEQNGSEVISSPFFVLP